MGAYEFIPPTLPGDLNGDDLVDAADLDLVRAHWGQAVTPGDTFSGDANGDGAVNSADLDLVRTRWSPVAQAAAADAVLADTAAEVDSDVYGPRLAKGTRREPGVDFGELADFVWGKRSLKARGEAGVWLYQR